jgi:hypothetical protein
MTTRINDSTAAQWHAVRAVVVCLAAFLATGCMRAQIQESRQLATAIGKDEGVVLLAKPVIEGAGTEEDFTDCIADDLRGGRNGFKVQDNDEFVDKLFPWFEPSTAPTRPEALTQLLLKPGVAESIAETGVRYVVWLDGATRKTDGGGSIACGAGPGGAGCIGFGWWEKESDYQATIWDLSQSRAAGTVTTNVTGTSALVGVIVPLPFIARVQGTACNRMTEQLRTFLQGEEVTASR